MCHYYKISDFGKRIGVDRHTVSKWKKRGILVPFVDSEGREYYTEEQASQYDKVRFGGRVYKNENWIDFSNIRKEKTTERFDWKWAAQEKIEIPFFYNGTLGSLTILACKNNKLTVVIDGRTDSISTCSLTTVGLDKITGVFSKDYKFALGTRIQCEKTDITILKQIRMGRNNARGYIYICNRCHQKNKITEYNINDKGCCPVCSGTKVVTGINDIATTDPWMIPFFRDKELTKIKSHGAGDMLHFICPDCGRVRKKLMAISTLYATRSIACVCGDGYKYPNKFMYSVLEQLLLQGKIHSFEKEFNDGWTQGRRYDFLISLCTEGEKQLIIEMDGGLGHGNRTIDKSISPEDTAIVDKWKDEQALKHGLQVVRVDALFSDKDYLSERIKSTLSDVIDFQNIDWEKAEQFAFSNLVKKLCQYYESNKPITTKQLGEIFHIDQSTALNYLKKGEKYGWCKYDWDYYEECKYAGSRRQSVEREKRVIKICDYYQRNKPILAIQIARDFDINVSTVLSYLKAGEKLGYEPYDRNYKRSKNVEQLRNASRDHLKRPVFCFTKDGSLYKEYSSLKEAADDNGVSVSAIHRCCKKKGTSAGMIFRFTDDCELKIRS